MAVTIKAIKQGQLPATAEPLYQAPAKTAAIVKNMRFVNTGAAAITINVWFKRGSNTYRVLPKDLSIAPGQLFLDNDELTLDPGDEIQGQASSASTVDYVFSGVERDQS